MKTKRKLMKYFEDLQEQVLQELLTAAAASSDAAVNGLAQKYGLLKNVVIPATNELRDRDDNGEFAGT